MQGIEAVVKWQQRVLSTIASSSIVRIVDFGFFGPVGVSETDDRFFHLATVF